MLKTSSWLKVQNVRMSETERRRSGVGVVGWWSMDLNRVFLWKYMHESCFYFINGFKTFLFLFLLRLTCGFLPTVYSRHVTTKSGRSRSCIVCHLPGVPWTIFWLAIRKVVPCWQNWQNICLTSLVQYQQNRPLTFVENWKHDSRHDTRLNPFRVNFKYLSRETL